MFQQIQREFSSKKKAQQTKLGTLGAKLKADAVRMLCIPGLEAYTSLYVYGTSL
jgi:hypothetical protein